MDIVHFEWSSDGEVLSLVDVDFRSKEIRVKDFTDIHMQRFFGYVGPSWDMLQWRLEDRVIPKTRDPRALKAYLKDIGVDFWEPLQILRVTEGEMAEDNYRLKIIKEDINEWLI